MEAELTWLATDQLTVGGSFSYTPNEYSEDLFMLDPAGVRSTRVALRVPPRCTAEREGQSATAGSQNLSSMVGRRMSCHLIVEEFDFLGSYAWIDKVYYSLFKMKTKWQTPTVDLT